MKETKGKKRIFSDADSDDESDEEDALEETDDRQDRHTNGDKFIGVVITTRPPKGWYPWGRL
jgi:hypothetical protein